MSDHSGGEFPPDKVPALRQALRLAADDEDVRTLGAGHASNQRQHCRGGKYFSKFHFRVSSLVRPPSAACCPRSIRPG